MSATTEEDRWFEICAELMLSAEISRLPAYEDWQALSNRVTVLGRMHEITADAYGFFLEASAPRLYGGNRFCLADGDGGRWGQVLT